MPVYDQIPAFPCGTNREYGLRRAWVQAEALEAPNGPGDGGLTGCRHARRQTRYRRPRAVLIRESRMGIRSWLRSLRSEDVRTRSPDDEPNSLIKYRYEDPAFEQVEKAAAQDVAAVEEDAKYFGPDSPASQDELSRQRRTVTAGGWCRPRSGT